MKKLNLFIYDPKQVSCLPNLYKKFDLNIIPLNSRVYFKIIDLNIPVKVTFLDDLLIKYNISKHKIKSSALKEMNKFFTKNVSKKYSINFLKSNSEIFIKYFTVKRVVEELIKVGYFSNSSKIGVLRNNQIQLNFKEGGIVYDPISFLNFSKSKYNKFIVNLNMNEKILYKYFNKIKSYIALNINYFLNQFTNRHGFNVSNFLEYVTKHSNSKSGSLVVLFSAEWIRYFNYESNIESKLKLNLFSIIDTPVSNVVNFFSIFKKFSYLNFSSFPTINIKMEDYNFEKFVFNCWLPYIHNYYYNIKNLFSFFKIKTLITSTNQQFPLPLIIATANDTKIRTIAFPHSLNDEIVPWLNSSMFIPFNDTYRNTLILKNYSVFNKKFETTPTSYISYTERNAKNLKKNYNKITCLILLQDIDGGNDIVDRDLGYFISFLHNLDNYVNLHFSKIQFKIKDHPRIPLDNLLKTVTPNLLYYKVKDNISSSDLINDSNLIISHIGIGSVAHSVIENDKTLNIFLKGHKKFYLNNSFVSHNILYSKKVNFFANFRDIK